MFIQLVIFNKNQKDAVNADYYFNMNLRTGRLNSIQQIIKPNIIM